MPAPGAVRVLHLCAGNLYGGVERIVAECAAARALCPQMIPSFAVCFEGRLAEEIESTGAHCWRLGGVRMSRPWTVVSARRRLAAVLDAQPRAVVVCHSSWMLGLAAPVVLKAGGTLVLWLHDRVSGAGWAERWAARTRPHLIIANSRFTGESVRALYPGASHAVVYAPVHPDVSGEGRCELRKTFGADEQTPVVIVASRFERWKGHGLLVTALAQVAEPWQLWIAGRPQRSHEEANERDLRASIKASGLEGRIRFLGERRDVAACMRAADIHCQPNTGAEPFGLAFIEALNARLPVVTTAVGGALEIVTESCGVLVPPDDPAALAGALRKLITNPAARRELGSRGPSRAHELCDPARQLATLAAVVSAAGANAVPA